MKHVILEADLHGIISLKQWESSAPISFLFSFFIIFSFLIESQAGFSEGVRAMLRCESEYLSTHSYILWLLVASICIGRK